MTVGGPPAAYTRLGDMAVCGRPPHGWVWGEQVLPGPGHGEAWPGAEAGRTS